MDFRALKSSLFKKKVLYEDPNFKAEPASLVECDRTSRYLKWLRPYEIIDSRKSKPLFIIDGATRFDLNQGDIGDCWFVAAVACLAISHEQLFGRVVPGDQDFETEYAGLFRFNFFRFGRWVEVVIDDRLPTVHGQLLYGRNLSQPNEFWFPLIEKAYAKLNGSYDNIGIGGHTCNALVDFTGGISESIDLRRKRMAPVELFDNMYAMMSKCSMLGCDIEAPQMSSAPEKNGLFKGHAYSITNMIRLTSKGQTVRLLRLRNPWGKKEWNGKWSDKSSEWAAIPLKAKQDIGLEVMDDGEFWMSFEDMCFNFDFVWICHLEPDAISEEISQSKGRTMWEVMKVESEWCKGFNAGGCGNKPNEELFWKNPQISMSLMTPSRSSPDGVGSGGLNCFGSSKDKPKTVDIVVSLMQESIRGDKNVGMSFMIYKIREGAAKLLNGENYDRRALLLARDGPNFINLREVSEHFALELGNYVIIPCTFYPNTEAKFFLRIFTETPAQSNVLDKPTSVALTRSVEDDVTSLFSKYSNAEPGMDAKELTAALNNYFRKDPACGFTLEVSRNLVAMFSKNSSAVITLDEFQTLLKEVATWKDKFKTLDKDKSGDIDTYEMTDLFKSVGMQLSRQVMKSVVKRYGGKKCRLSLEDFIICVCRINVMYGQFTGLLDSQPQSDTKVQLTLEEFLAETV